MIKDITFFLSMLGWFNGIILSQYFLFFIKEKSLANRLFGVLLLLLSLRVGKSAIWWFNPDLPIIYIQFGLCVCFLIGPVLFYYVQSYLEKTDYLGKNAKILLSVHVLLAIGTFIFLTDKDDLIYWKKGLVHFIYLYWTLWTLVSGYLLRNEIGLLLQRKALSNGNKWILSVYFSFLFLVITYLISFAGNTGVLYITGPLIFSLVIYLNILLFLFRKNMGDLTSNEPKYVNKIDESVALESMGKLKDLMSQELTFTNSDLKIADIAQKLDMTVHHLSQVLNDNYNTSFNSFINLQRIEYSKKLIEEKSDQLTFEAIGKESGFNSKTTFFTLFKKVTGMTPNEYRERQKSGNSRT